MAPRLTIGIPTVNRASLLRRTMESALAQTCADVEVPASDNASPDETPSVVAEYAARGVRCFRHDVRMTAQRHGDFLREQARGEFFVGLSDDDFLELGTQFLAQHEAEKQAASRGLTANQRS
jgi:glycosyltransferase involved in cell wall biosynthesis